MKEITFETNPPIVQTNTISEAFASIGRDPAQLFRQWNYKGAIMSGTMRAPIFLITYLVARENIRLALGAAAAQFAFRFLFAGVGGALIQSFRRVEPAWKALLAILMIVPAISHVFEYLVQLAFAHYTGTGENTDAAIIRSICISVMSALFSLFIMRRNVLIVGEAESKSIFSDIAQFPILIVEFLGFVPLETIKMWRRGAYLTALMLVGGVGVFSELVGWAMTGKLLWSINKGKIVAPWGVHGLILLALCLILAALYLRSAAETPQNIR